MSKRSAPFSAPSEPSSKRAAPSSLNSFFATTHTPRPPSPLVHSDPLTDRSSTFIAHAAPCTSSSSASAFQSYIRALRAPSHPVECSHEMLGWRVVAPKPGKSGLESEEDWAVRDGGEDDGEKDGGSTIREVLRREGAVDVMVVVSRLYGGQMLGPARFAHIRTVTSQALSRLSLALALPALLARLAELDAEILALSPPSAKPLSEADREKTRAQYGALDVQKAERLVQAREKRVELLRRQKEKRDAEEKERREVEELHRRAEEEAVVAAVEAEAADGGGQGAGEDREDEEDEAAAFEQWKREREEAKLRKKKKAAEEAGQAGA
ncbi:hypothetical protein JCM6882_000592 [Rhodosporidiobolus microsporus]